MSRLENEVLFATGVHLRPYKFPDGTWGWVVSEFEDDSFLNGWMLNPPETANTLEELFEED